AISFSALAVRPARRRAWSQEISGQSATGGLKAVPTTALGPPLHGRPGAADGLPRGAGGAGAVGQGKLVGRSPASTSFCVNALCKRPHSDLGVRRAMQHILELQRVGHEIVQLIFQTAAVSAEIDRIGPVSFPQRAQLGAGGADRQAEDVIIGEENGILHARRRVAQHGSQCHVARKWALLHSRCSLRDNGGVNILKLLGVRTPSVVAVVTLSRAAAPERILTRPPTVTACRGRHFAPRVKQSLPTWLPTPV